MSCRNCCGNNLNVTSATGCSECSGSTSCCTPTCSTDVCGSLCEEICTTVLNPTVKSCASWNVPSCGGTIEIAIKTDGIISPGSYLWNSEYGYFQILSYNALTNKVKLSNTCACGDVNVGMNVPSGALFIVTDPPALVFSNNILFLTTDFVAPAVGGCVSIGVTLDNVLFIGAVIHLAGGTYTVTGIISSKRYIICNEGGGVAAGTVIRASNSDCVFQYTILIDNIVIAESASASQELALSTDGGPTDAVLETSININNPSFLNNLILLCTCKTDFSGGAVNTASDNFGILSVAQPLVDGVSLGGSIYEDKVDFGTDNARAYSNNHAVSRLVTVAPQQSVVIGGRGSLTLTGLGGASGARYEATVDYPANYNLHLTVFGKLIP